MKHMSVAADVVIRPLVAEDEIEWRRLWTAYLEFYGASVPEAVFTSTFQRLTHPTGEYDPQGRGSI